MTLSTADLRNKFINYFKSHGHQAVASSSLVPADDPTLLFTNAGMNQFKDTFLGTEKRSYTRAVSSQRCVRAGGKHNDLENVGYTARHHTFFEMMGNFSFGDYFKKEAIEFAWNFLTSEVGLPKEKLLVTVYSEDDEAFDIWENHIGVPKEKIIRISTSDNFWSMGDTGPCGPCSEIFYDHGAHIWGGPPGTPEEDGDRFIEIWNLVFMQFNKQADGTMEPLPKPSIDTGMGLERISAILQNVHSNYEIDLFQNLIKSAASIVGTEDLENKSLRVIADHIRSCSFLICDGVMPSNEGRGYVLRRIIRRAVRHGYQLGANDIFFYKLVASLANEMGEAYPELVDQLPVIEKVLRVEEEQFSKTLARGMAMLNDTLASLEGDTVPGDVVFKLYDTYGFPTDLTNDVAREHELKIDEEGFEAAMQAQRARAQQASNFGADYNSKLAIDHTTSFTGYTDVEGQANVVELIADNAFVEKLEDGQEGVVVLDSTPFYAESGGQAGDKGVLRVANGEFIVTDTQKMGNAFAHKGIAKGSVSKGDTATAAIDSANREAIKKNHSATHLLHAALREILGEHVTQKGSLVEAPRMRFDFSHFEAVTTEQLAEIERRVNQEIRANHSLATELMDLEEAKASGAMALFGEKYDEKVRVVTMGPFSVELCGGTHVARTGDIGLFKITSEAGIASGVRRIEAVTGEQAIEVVQTQQATLSSLSSLLKTDSQNVLERVVSLQNQTKELEKALNSAKQKLASQQGADMLSNAVEINGVKVLIANLEGVEAKSLRSMMDDIKNRIGEGIVVLGVANNAKVNLIAGVTKNLTDKVKAGELVNFVASQVGGKGGGRPDMAQAGGDKPENLGQALDSVNVWLQDKL
ncbi:alanyl-tRNA synthetase [Alteromonas mediterranea MED64]|jgi:alanyl-tRNA synthetase|uniref:Alanine--tRNA ligase n=1 Tax=Alteromonas mediterranea (strain DSM 17117 / CIP 110805 / LMG 28347 / Deep ecotype) TaxID=1774373 RepID=F2G420_ALTMD|nr:alanine--tRNA ligase [Alteromonas mediterranea]AGP92841.1 alanyl-tRNA synthetase [Alteromonas mediterranea U8]MBR9783253.1 alanine--tRNA ligase [Gammaproteobacteria bacterium]AEA97362.1 alanyl-tRNA synthetase [Alteromonas mediterranea DE]AGP81017.1 alanyl-tRNA synthetase [Alteromonas mediterranea MED64]AGP84855.1 alanyl-tRNA synthetase [Alteromonas mediterranea U4]|tara:strand:- start:151 stop:2748 length:2598 start_codon:yes stop_codon:yes gene_type:complete